MGGCDIKSKTVEVSGQYGPSALGISVKSLGAVIIILTAILFQPVDKAFARMEEKIIKAPIINQFPELPTGCEATASAMLLKWVGINVSKEEVAKSLPRGRIPVIIKNKIYGDNPDSVFVGDPFSKNGYGVFHKPIADIINKYLPGCAKDMTGVSFDEVLKMIDSNIPVIVWCTIGNEHPKVLRIWYDSKGNKIVWQIPEHSVLLVGYTESHVIVNDPWTGKICRYQKSSFKEHWEMMGRQVVTIRKPWTAIHIS